MKIFLCLFTILFITNLKAQLPHTFTQVARNSHYGSAQDVAVGLDGTLYVACLRGGLKAYTYDGTSFTNTAHINDGGDAYGLAIGPDGTVFLANNWDGLRAYSYDGSSFTNTAHINDGGGYAQAVNVCIGLDGTVFLANGNEGLIAYSYSGYSGLNEKNTHILKEIVLHQNFPNPFNPSTTIEVTLPKSEFVELKVYNILGKEVSTLVSNKLNQGNHTYTFDGKNLASGIYYYQLMSGEYQQVKKMILLR